MYDIHLVYSLDTVQWADYILGYLTKESYNLKILRQQDINILSDQSSSLLSNASTISRNLPAPSCPAKTLIVIVSPLHLRFLHENLDFRYDGLIADPCKGQLLLCGAEAADFDELDASGFSLSQRFPRFEEWTRLDHDEHATLLTNAIIFVETPTDPGQLQRNRSTNGSRERSKVKFTMKPEQVRSHDLTVVTLFFEKKLPDPVAGSDPGQVVVVFDSYQGGGQWNTSIIADRCNPYTCQFTAPPHPVGYVRVKVLLDGLELGNQLLNYTPSPTVGAMKDLVDVHVQLLAELIECLEEAGHSLVDLDQRLVKNFQESHRASEQMFTLIQFTTRTDPTQLKYPTLVHVAARHGLDTLSTLLSDLPDVKLAIRMINADDHTPEQIARANGHDNLAQILHDLDTNDSDDEGDYVPLRPNYIIKVDSDEDGSSAEDSGDDDGYMEMSDVILKVMKARDSPDISTKSAFFRSEDEQREVIVENPEVQTGGDSNGACAVDEPQGATRPSSGQQERNIVGTADNYEQAPKSLTTQSQQPKPEPSGPEPPEPEPHEPEPRKPEPTGPEPSGPEPTGSEPPEPEPSGPEPPELPELRQPGKTEPCELLKSHKPHETPKTHEPREPHKPSEPLEPFASTCPTLPPLSPRNKTQPQHHHPLHQQHFEPFEFPYPHPRQLQQQQLSQSVSQTNLSSMTQLGRIPGSGMDDSPVATVPEGQKELIDILNQIVSGQMTLAEGECLAEEWKMRHPKSNQQNQAKLAKLRVEVDKSQTKGRFFWSKIGRRPSDVADKTSSSATPSKATVGLSRSTSFSPLSNPATMKPKSSRVAMVGDKTRRYSKRPMIDQVAYLCHQLDTTSTSTTLTMTVPMGDEFLSSSMVEANSENRCSAASEASSRESYRSATSQISTSSGVDIDNVEDEQPREMEKVRLRYPHLQTVASEHMSKVIKRKSRNLEMLEEELSSTDAPSPPPVPKATSKSTKKSHGTVLRLQRLKKHDNPSSGTKAKAENQSQDGRRRSHSDGNIGKPSSTPEKKNFWRSLVSSRKNSAPEKSSPSLPASQGNQQPISGSSLFSKMQKNRSRSPQLTTVKASLTLNKGSSERCLQVGSCSQGCSQLLHTQANAGCTLPSIQLQPVPTTGGNIEQCLAHDNEANIHVPDEASSKTPWTIYEHYEKSPKIPEKNNLTLIGTEDSKNVLENEERNVGHPRPSEGLIKKISSSGSPQTPEVALPERRAREQTPALQMPCDSSAKVIALLGEEHVTHSGSANCDAAPELPPLNERPFKKAAGRRPLPIPSQPPATTDGTHLMAQTMCLEVGRESSGKVNTEEVRAEKIRIVHPPFPTLPCVTVPEPLSYDTLEQPPLRKEAEIRKVDTGSKKDLKIIQEEDSRSEKGKAFCVTQQKEHERVLKANSETQNEDSCSRIEKADKERILTEEYEKQIYEDRNQPGKDSNESRKVECKALKENKNEKERVSQDLGGLEATPIEDTGEKLIHGCCDKNENQNCSEIILSHIDHRSLDSDSENNAMAGNLEKNDSSQPDLGRISSEFEAERKEKHESFLSCSSQSAPTVESSTEAQGLDEDNSTVSSLTQLGKSDKENLESTTQKNSLQALTWLLHLPAKATLSTSCTERPSVSLPGTLKRRRVPSPSKPLQSLRLSTISVLPAPEQLQPSTWKRRSSLAGNTSIFGADTGIRKSILRRSQSMEGAQFDWASLPTEESNTISKQDKISDPDANLPDPKTDTGSRHPSLSSEPSVSSVLVVTASEALSPTSTLNVLVEPTTRNESTKTDAPLKVQDKLGQKEVENSPGPAHKLIPNVSSVQLRRDKLPCRIQTKTDNQDFSSSQLTTSRLSVSRRSMQCIESLPTKLRVFLERQISPTTKRHSISYCHTGPYHSNLSFATEAVNTRTVTPAQSEQDEDSSSMSRTKSHSIYGDPCHFSSLVLEADSTSTTSLKRREQEEMCSILRPKQYSSSCQYGKFNSTPSLASKREGVSDTTFGAAEQENESSIANDRCQQNPYPPVHFSSAPSLISIADNTISTASGSYESDKESSMPRTRRPLIASQYVHFSSTPSLASETENTPAPFPRVMELRAESLTSVTCKKKAGLTVSSARSKCPPPVLPKPKQRPRSLSDLTAKQRKTTKASDSAGIQKHKIHISSLVEKENAMVRANVEAKATMSLNIVDTDKAFDSVATRKLMPAESDVSDKDKAFDSVFADDAMNQASSPDSVSEELKTSGARNKPKSSPLLRPLLLDNSWANPRLRSFDLPRPHSICSPINEECFALTSLDSDVFKKGDDVSSTSSDDHVQRPKHGPSVLPNRRRSESLGKR